MSASSNVKKSFLFLFVGVFLGALVMYWLNRPALPPSVNMADVNTADVLEFRVEIPGDILSLTHGFSGSLKRIPENVASLENSSLSNMIGLIARVRDKDGKLVGLASELEIFPDDIGPRPGMKWDTHWTITTPVGSLLIYEIERIPMAHIPPFASVIAGNDWAGAIAADVSSGPHTSGRGVIVGGTGIYAGASGTFIERVELRKLTTKGEMAGSMYLQFYFDHKENKSGE